MHSDGVQAGMERRADLKSDRQWIEVVIQIGWPQVVKKPQRKQHQETVESVESVEWGVM